MKKQLLVGSALLAVISVFPQNGSRPAGFHNTAGIIAGKFSSETNPVLKQAIGPVENPNVEPEQSAAAMPPSTINWKLIGGSNNIYGSLVSSTRPLQYNAKLNAVSFVHRKSFAYQASPMIASTATSGIIVAEISTNWGTTFDSTCIYQNATNWGRFPQGGIYNPAGNTNIANAYFVGSGPTVGSASFSGNWYASKKLDAFNNTPGADQQFIASNAASYAANMSGHGFSRLGFACNDDGVAHSMGYIADNNLTIAGLRGYALVKGVFNAGAFTWTMDSIIPSVLIDGAGDKVIGNAQMAWNQAGTVGYAMILGVSTTATGSNKGYQPLVYKTTNSGTSWAQIPSIDFNSAAMQPLVNHLAASTNTLVRIPSFSDFDVVVDANDRLHLAAIFKSGYSDHVDSLGYTQSFTISINPGSEYAWDHTPGKRPYLYDFITDGTSAWTAMTIDSLGSQEASGTSGNPGYNENPWDPTAANSGKTDNVDSRIGLARTPDGKYITYCWSESDTNATTGQLKYNNKPNLRTRCMAIGSITAQYNLSTTEINVTKVSLGQGTNNANVTNRATLNYMSPTTGSATSIPGAAVGSSSVDIYTPIVVTNSNPYAQLTNNTIWYQSGKLSYYFPPPNGVKENAQNSANNSLIYPNPASNNAVLAIDLKDNSNVDITVLNIIGQTVKTNKAQGQVGQNNINIDLNGLSTGIYLVN
ncbi:MAG: T9SS type A sorting domain-containing protein, partial [Bacteroidota bacterium]